MLNIDKLIQANMYRVPVDQYEALVTPMLTFTTREEYLAWVHEWKATYAALTTHIRFMKRNEAALDPSVRSSSPPVEGAPIFTYVTATGTQYPVWKTWARHVATQLLLLRRLGKAKSWQMKLARTAAERVA